MLDLACGSGRHAHLLAGLGLAVAAVDRNFEAILKLQAEEAPLLPLFTVFAILFFLLICTKQVSHYKLYNKKWLTRK